MHLQKFYPLKPRIFVVIVGLAILLAGSPVLKHYIALAAGNPSVASPVQGQAFNTQVITINGTSDANASVSIFIDNVLAGTTSAAEDGNWSFTTGTLAEGPHTLYATIPGSSGDPLTSDTIDFAIDLTPPQVVVDRPIDNSYVNLPLVEGITEPGAEVTVTVYGGGGKVTADMFGKWSYFDPGLPEGTHSVTAIAVDRAGNVGNPLTCLFILDITRPVVTPDLFPVDDMTGVPVSVSAYVYIREKSPIDDLAFKSAIRLTEYVSDTVYNIVSGTVYNSVYTDAAGESYYRLAFVPELLLRNSTRYEAEVSSEVYDAAGNWIMPRRWTFTTVSDVYSENPHGNYIDNVNTCVNCHAPHTATLPKLVRPQSNPAESLDNYCNACHDGTSAPLVNNWSRASLHNQQISIDGVRGSSSCTGCHNPHLTWTTDNPNFLQDYYYFSHSDPTNPFLPNSSEEKLCEACHEGTIKDDPRVNYIQYRYEKRHTTSGAPQDYSLCLRCHDGSRAVNIAVYYNGPSAHFIQPLDASPISGFMPCADCHETHGADNTKLLKDKLGHNHARPFIVGSTWDSAAERRFCTGCHNGQTELYGIMVEFNPTIMGHETAGSDPCSKCHGGSAAVAAHAPTVPR